MPTLPHTGLQIPNQPRYEVTSCQELALLRATPFLATLSHGSRKIGSAQNYGDGDATEFVPHGDFALADFARFADACRLDGQPVSLSLLLDLLIEEFNVGRSLRAQALQGRTLLREVGPEGGVTISGTISMPATADDRRRAHAALRLPLTAGAMTQFWNGNCWEHLADGSKT
ncbi:hypothetical protein [Kitasatospora phosalacinea]|uniref:Uncharacterized protein n=1 Tax=Kitasatospora phosalacinea TaxID=2065 RepID=A0A9W6PPP4_9ACTN|nr:hypothetical protein [Kitasatospora phosalacinea]GLW58567.1 hypothetical protein Kpho01_65780 [Kitasatospora phosalacinea]